MRKVTPLLAMHLPCTHRLGITVLQKGALRFPTQVLKSHGCGPGLTASQYVRSWTLVQQ